MEIQVQLLAKLFHTIKYHFTAHRPDKYGLLHCSVQNQKSPSKTLLTEIKARWMGATALGFVWEISANLLLLIKLGSTLRVLSPLKQKPHKPGKTFLSDAVTQDNKISHLTNSKQN